MQTICKTYRYRLNPTVEQDRKLKQFAGARRFIWNWALDRKQTHYRETGKSLKFHILSRELTLLKRQKDTAWLCSINAQSLQQSLRDLERAYQQFFNSRDKKNRTGFPKFKSRKSDPLRFRIPQDVRIEKDSIVSVPNIGKIKAIIHRPVIGITKSATFTYEACGHWYVNIVVEQSIMPKRVLVRSHVGIDSGLKSFAILSNGTSIDNPRWFRKHTGKLRKAQKSLCRKNKSSRNYYKARTKVARLHYKIRNQRKDFLHKYSNSIVRQYDLISIEDLNIKGLARTKLSKSIYDVGWGMFRSMLTYKSDWNNSHIQKIGRFYPSSKMCYACGAVNDLLTLGDREWFCVCGASNDRDINAARNIDREGLRLFNQDVAVGYTETKNDCGDLVNPLNLSGIDQ